MVEEACVARCTCSAENRAPGVQPVVVCREPTNVLGASRRRRQRQTEADLDTPPPAVACRFAVCSRASQTIQFCTRRDASTTAQEDMRKIDQTGTGLLAAAAAAAALYPLPSALCPLPTSLTCARHPGHTSPPSSLLESGFRLCQTHCAGVSSVQRPASQGRRWALGAALLASSYCVDHATRALLTHTLTRLVNC
ncbi:hypothetical protein EJ04DRAFT_67964 [Polyplosphaeria fusca]|uniref:Uncharacterized protein n=1 Tax=Polyplosphaeria fusca TaxID=682080 RepID=A0A9P4V4T3_9PLEO|nr:hypothetical protein EJ04DRAFT_67964 [Polyplosphaeria fusca]